MATSPSARRGTLAAPMLLLLCLGTASANASVNASTSATPGSTARAAASTSGTGESLSVVSVSPRTDCGSRGVSCCGGGDKQEDYCNFGSFCSSGICATCGTPGGTCCPGSTCEFTNSCNENNLCVVTCGLPDLPCCPEELDYTFSTDGAGCLYSESRCLSDVCTACGGIGQPCCSEDRCDSARSECITATGVCGEPTCGHPGLPCCDDADYSEACESSAECVAGSCVECGVNGAACCGAFSPDYPGFCYEANGACTEEGICAGGQPDAPAPAPKVAAIVPNGTDCGSAGQRCCGADVNADSACSPSSFCSFGVCASCGSPGSACCAGSTCFRGECNADNICAITCGLNGFRCCTADDAYDGPYSYGPSPLAAEGPAEGPDADTAYSDPFFRECGGEYSGSFYSFDSLCSAGDVCTPCGQEGEQCCKDDYCAIRAKCNSAANICTPPTCGREGQPCCDPSEEAMGLVCESRRGCFDGTCHFCGFDGQPCCPDTVDGSSFATDCEGEIAECSAENICINALTPSGDCGFLGDPCCEGENCDSGKVCVDETCTRCGSEGSPCCRGDTCDYAGDCTNNVCGPPVCGNIGLPCCADDISFPPCTSGACAEDECVLCGLPGKPCCPTRIQCFFGSRECLTGNICEDDGDYAPFSLNQLPARGFAPAPAPLPPRPPAMDVDVVPSA